MGCYILKGNPPIDVNLRRSARAKRLSLRVSRLDGRVTLTMPHHVRKNDGLVFLKDREAWLRHHLSTLAPIKKIRIGGTVPYEGRDMQIATTATGPARFSNEHIQVRADRPTGPQVKALLKQASRTVLAQASDHYAERLGVNYSRLSLRDTRSRWGSCSSVGTLMFSWRLIMAPPAVLHYVAAHEVAHLVEMNHSNRFWNVVEGLVPGYRTERQWLRDEGDQLHRLDFGD